PGIPTGGDEETFEFIELQNVSGVTVDLTNVRFTNGITYTFPTGRTLPPGERVVVVHDLAAFQRRYPDATYPGLSAKTVGPWVGGLDNGGEPLTLVDNAGGIIATFTYSDAPPWPAGPDGGGATLVFTTRTPLTALTSDGNNWFAHGRLHGNPGGPDITGYSSWASSHNGSINGTGDGDQDGVIDVLEYLVGGDTATSSVHQLPTSGTQQFTVNNVVADYLVLSYTRA